MKDRQNRYTVFIGWPAAGSGANMLHMSQ